MYTTREGVTVGPVVFADDNLSPLSLTQEDQIDPLLAAYRRYTSVSGLNINVHKSTILCINCNPSLIQALQDKGFSTLNTIRHLGNKHSKYNRRNPFQNRSQSSEAKDHRYKATYGHSA